MPASARARRARHARLGLVVVVVAVLAALAPTAGADTTEPPPPASSAAPVLTVTPDSDLVNGQQVVVAGTGFTGNSSVGFAACIGPSPVQDDCDVSNIGYATTDAGGAFSVPFHVRRVLHTNNATVDCATALDSCRVSAAKLSDYNESASAVINFDPTVPLPPPPTLFVVPSSTGLLDAQEIGIFGSGFPPQTPVGIQQCVAGGSLAGCRQLGYGGADSSGGILAVVSVRRQIHQFLGASIDCAAAPGTCELVVTSFADPDARGVQPLGFDPAGPLPVPILHVVPDTDLTYKHEVAVSGSGFGGAGIAIVQCKSGATDIADCRAQPVGMPPSGADSSFDAVVVVRRFLALQAGTFDCASAPGACDVVAIGYPDGVTARAPLAFDPGAPVPPPPVLAVAPDAGLPYRQSVEVHGTGYPPNLPIELSQCVAGSLWGCAGEGTRYVVSDGAGSFETSLPVIRSLRTYGSPAPSVVDCADAPGTCEVRTSSYVDEDASVGVPLTFDPSAPIPVPSATVTPSTGLAGGQIVAVHGEGFAPGEFVVAAQCESGGSLYSSGCSIAGYRYAFADEAGEVQLSFRVRGAINIYSDGTGAVEERDCAESPGACVLRMEAQFDPNGIVVVPLEFDPQALPPPTPEMTIRPGSVLTDGQEITIDAHGFLPDTQLAAVQCTGPEGEGSGTTCGAFAASLYVQSDANGEVHVTTTARQVFTPALGGAALDCGYAPGNCRFVIAEVQGDTADAMASVEVTFVPGVAVGGEVLVAGSGAGRGSESATLAFTGTSLLPVASIGVVVTGLGFLLLAGSRGRRRSLGAAR